jgi:5-methylcytosine-specific restriction endonuclease McrA
MVGVTEQGAGKRALAALERLRRFLENEMTMSHVYQPVMIRTILEGGGAATRRQIASAFLAADLSQLEYYEQVVSRYPGPVLRRHGIVDYEAGVYRLAGGLNRLDEWQRASLIAICDARVADFVSRRQAAIWNHRARNADPVPGTLRWEVLRRAMGRCEACGISSQERALEVDHILPRAKGGTNDLWNLQALCSLCNVQKLDRDAADFHGAHEAVTHRQAGCPLCGAEPVHANALAFAVLTDTELLVAPRRHAIAWLDLWQAELNALRQIELLAAGQSARSGSVSMVMMHASDGDCGHLAIVSMS